MADVPDEALVAAIPTAAEHGLAVELFVGEVAYRPMVFHAQRSCILTHPLDNR